MYNYMSILKNIYIFIYSIIDRLSFKNKQKYTKIYDNEDEYHLNDDDLDYIIFN